MTQALRETSETADIAAKITLRLRTTRSCAALDAMVATAGPRLWTAMEPRVPALTHDGRTPVLRLARLDAAAERLLRWRVARAEGRTPAAQREEQAPGEWGIAPATFAAMPAQERRNRARYIQPWRAYPEAEREEVMALARLADAYEGDAHAVADILEAHPAAWLRPTPEPPPQDSRSARDDR